MKVIISSKYLKAQLDKMGGIGSFYSSKILVFDGGFNLIINGRTATFYCDGKDFESFQQEESRWDWLYETIKNVPEQPVILELSQTKLKLIFDF